MVLPASLARDFPGNREEAKRAGITPKIRERTIEYSMHLRVNNQHPSNVVTPHFTDVKRMYRLKGGGLPAAAPMV
jgi:hypothetical protein